MPINPGNLVQRLVGSFSQRASTSFDPRKSQLGPTPEEQAQWVRDITRIPGGIAGLLAGSENRDKYQKAFSPVVSPILRALGGLGLNPYASSEFTNIADAQVMGRANPFDVKKLRQGAINTFTNSRGMNAAAAGLSIPQIAASRRHLQRKGYGALNWNEMRRNNIPGVIGAVQEIFGNVSPAEALDIAERLAGPYSAYRNMDPLAWERAVRVAARNAKE